MDPNLILNRLNRLVRLDTTVFDEVRDDPKELVPAIIIVAVSALLASIGAWLWLALVGHDPYEVDFGKVFLKIILMGTLFNVGLWAVWVLVTYATLTAYFKEQADLQSLFRTMGYASFPLAATVVMLIPWLSFGVALIALVAWFVLSIYAVQATTGAHSNHVIAANLAGFDVFAILMAFLARSTGMTNGIFVNTENGYSTGHGAIVEGDNYKAPSVDDILNR
jgi:hypothetical protein